MATKRISVNISQVGTVAATTVGTRGPGCLDEVELTRELIGVTTSDGQFTADFHASSTLEVGVVEHVAEEGWA